MLTLVKLLIALVVTGILVAGVCMPAVFGAGLVARHYATKWLDTACTLQETKPPQPTVLYARDGKTVLARLFTQDRKTVPLNEVPTYLQDALIATEDRRFYSHHGVDLRGLIRSAVSTTNGDTQGGSTLTMQYVKQIRYYQAGDDKAKQQAAIAQTIQRKMEDAKCALDIEGPRHRTKKQILDGYLNIAFFGEHAYGIEVAAETYFDKPVSKLTLAESALLVGLLRAPTAYDPFLHYAAAKQRRDEVLQNLVSAGKLSQLEADRQKATSIALASRVPPMVKQGCANADTTISNAAFFCEYAVNWLRNTSKISESTLQTGGLKIITTIDPRLQNSAQASLAATVPATAPTTAVLPVLDPKTGDVLAMAASKTYGAGKGQTEQPIFTSYTAAGASTYKLFPLVAALETGVPGTLQLRTVGNTGRYRSSGCLTKSAASNGDANIKYNAVESLASATAKSSNTYFVALADQVFGCDLSPIVDVMQRLGMKGMQRPSEENPKLTYAQVIVGAQRAQQLVLGSVPTSALELTAAYAAVANRGRYNAPSPILSITAPNENMIPARRTPYVQAISPETAAKAVKILAGDTKAPGTSADRFVGWYDKQGNSLIAGKTGTNESTKKNENGSIWFVGMTPDYTAAAGLINFDQSSAPSSGLPLVKTGQAYGDYAAGVWLNALEPTLTKDSWSWQQPGEVDGVNVPALTGRTLGEARKLLTERGFKMQIDGAPDQLLCASNAPYQSVAYYAPRKAPLGSTITVCQSSGVAAYTPPPPPPPPPVFTPVTRTRNRAPAAGRSTPSAQPTRTRTRTRTRTGTRTRTNTRGGG